MAGPNNTWAETWTAFGKLVELVNDHDNYANTQASANLLDNYDAVVNELDGLFLPRVQPKLERLMAAVAQPLTRQGLRDLFDPYILELARVGDFPELRSGQIDLGRALFRIKEKLDTDADTLNSRGMTINGVGSITGTGTGTIYRVSVDKDGNTLEAISPDTWTAEVVADQTGGLGGRAAEHRELWEVRGSRRAATALEYTGAGLRQQVASVDAQSFNLLRNASFEQGASAVGDNAALSTTTDITGWTAGAAASIKVRLSSVDSSYVFRGFQGDGQPGTTLAGLEFTGSTTLSQILQNVSPGVLFDAHTPYICLVRWKRLASATGTLRLRLGADNNTVDISTGSNGVWNTLIVGTDSGTYYDNFVEQDLDVQIATESLAVGTVVIDDVILAPMTFFPDLGWLLPVGGATPFLRGDTFSWSDTDGGSRAKFSYWLWRAYGDLVPQIGGWFPTDNATTETIPDP